MGLDHFEPCQVVEFNKPRRKLLAHAAQPCQSTALAAGPQDGLTAHSAACRSANLILKSHLAHFVAWPWQSCWPGHCSTGEPTLTFNPTMDVLGLRRGPTQRRRSMPHGFGPKRRSRGLHMPVHTAESASRLQDSSRTISSVNMPHFGPCSLCFLGVDRAPLWFGRARE